jgi:hypothetical protein
MKRFLQLTAISFACVVVTCSCSPREETPQSQPKSKVKEAVKEVVTKDFDLYKGAKDSLKESETKHKSELEQMERESK